MGIKQALPGHRALAPRPQMLLEKHALVRHVLVDDPQPFRIHRHDEARVHLPQWPQFPDARSICRSFHRLRLERTLAVARVMRGERRRELAS